MRRGCDRSTPPQPLRGARRGPRPSRAAAPAGPRPSSPPSPQLPSPSPRHASAMRRRPPRPDPRRLSPSPPRRAPGAPRLPRAPAREEKEGERRSKPPERVPGATEEGLFPSGPPPTGAEPPGPPRKAEPGRPGRGFQLPAVRGGGAWLRSGASYLVLPGRAEGRGHPSPLGLLIWPGGKRHRSCGPPVPGLKPAGGWLQVTQVGLETWISLKTRWDFCESPSQKNGLRAVSAGGGRACMVLRPGGGRAP